MIVRRACAADAAAIAAVFNAAWSEKLPMVPKMHSAAEDLVYFAGVVRDQEVYVVDDGGSTCGFIALTPGWVNHLYVEPAYHNRGAGTALLERAKSLQNELTLWTFQANAGARRFYESRGFRAVEFTDGAANEERTPDVRYTWARGVP